CAPKPRSVENAFALSTLQPIRRSSGRRNRRAVGVIPAADRCAPKLRPVANAERCPPYSRSGARLDVGIVGRSAFFRPPITVCNDAPFGGQRRALSTLQPDPALVWT